MRTVCGLDVHKDSVFVCIMNGNGEKFEARYGVLTPELEALRQLLLDHEVTEVTMESTSIYWYPVWRVLEGAGELKLVNPYFIKQLPGRKSDVRDAAWIAECTLKDLIRGSFVPEALVQRMRQYNRRIFDLNKAKVCKLTKLDALLQRCNTVFLSPRSACAFHTGRLSKMFFCARRKFSKSTLKKWSEYPCARLMA